MRKVHINITFIEAISHMSSDAKHLREILSNKEKLANFGIVGQLRSFTMYSLHVIFHFSLWCSMLVTQIVFFGATSSLMSIKTS